ncbi:hypothetical protein D9619_008227 [Psilocybe cf. subviscida]|uniref:Uncharacterized protein n=1 Tax=Psilocybe cf. subviscida TaxID=2480587 RepID=A0A8H5ATG0_9AGAR|nr:hypothetical protein D9619_008227 [Psilocybe cf. subviscida]
MAYQKSKDVTKLKAAIKNFELAVEQYRKHRDLSLRTTLINCAVAVWRHYEDCGQFPALTLRHSSLGLTRRTPSTHLLISNALARTYFEQYQRAFGPRPFKPVGKQEAFDNAVKHYTGLKNNPPPPGASKAALRFNWAPCS